MKETRLKELLEEVKNATVGVIGDFCLDAYWALDPHCDEKSVETEKTVNRVLAHRYSPGGASNVVANLAALGVGAIKAYGVIGPDVFGQELTRQLESLGVDCAGMVVQQDEWYTSVFAKPYMGENEQARFDFGTVNEINSATENELIGLLEKGLSGLDALIINQQLPKGYHSDSVVHQLNRLAAENPPCPIIVDSRHKSDAFKNVVLKINAIEAAALCGEEHDINRAITLDQLERFAKEIYERNNQPVIITRGERGMIVFDGKSLASIPGIQVLGTTDPVGAGDTAVSAIGAMIGIGASLVEAATIANMATSVTVQKLEQTGTASQDEMMNVGATLDSEIEIVSSENELGKTQHEVFDDDKTQKNGRDIQAVLFDLDGVLVDSEPLHARAWASSLSELGIPCPDNGFDDWIGSTDRALAENIDAMHEDSPGVEQLLVLKHRNYARLTETELGPFPGVRDGISKLDGLPLAVVTGSLRRDAMCALNCAGLTFTFDAVVTYEDVERHKPDPEPYLLAARLLHVEPESCVVVEDSKTGVASGLSAGCTVLALNTSLPASDLAGAHHHFRCTADALDWIIREIGNKR